jgi:hypothetical protein
MSRERLPWMGRLLTTPSRKVLVRLAVVSGGGTGVLALMLLALDLKLAPYGIVQYEFAWSAERAQTLFTHWKQPGMEAARESLRLDAWFRAYALFLSSVTLLAARAAPERWRGLGCWLGLAPFAAGGLDALENAALWRVLEAPGPPSEPLLKLAALAAAVKFLLLLASASYAATVGLSRWRRR